MAYQVDRFNGQFLVSVEDGTIDTTTDLRFVGKNYAGYGEVQNENFLHLLENFSNTTAPPRVVTGQVWYDSSNKKLKFYDGARFKVAGGAEVSATAPSGLSTGDFWWDTGAKQLYAWTGTEFTLVGPEASPDLGSSTISAAVVKGTVATDVGPHTILKVFSDDKVIGIFSKTEFTLDGSQNPIEDFTVVKKGLTLVKSQSGVSTDDYVFWGTANNANRLGGIAADQYLRKGENEFTAEVKFFDPGFSVGDGNDLRIRVENGDEVVVENRLGNDITFRITVAETTDERDVAIIQSTGVVPGSNSVYNLGSSLLKWNNVHATTFTGNVVGNLTGNTTGSHTGNVLANDGQVMINAATKQIGYEGAALVGTLTGSVTGSSATATNASKLTDLNPSVSVPGSGIASIPVRDTNGNITANQFVGIADRSDRTRINNAASDTAWNGASATTQYRTAMTTQTAWTIAARDGNADITARQFIGTATSAQYADLAEKYLADQEYEVGTVVAIGGDAEVTACKFSDRAIGVVSANPAYMMNSGLEGGTYIALKGRVPVKVVGTIKKGDRLVASDNGCGIHASFHQHPDIFAIALESSTDTGVKIIEALVL
jgi:hypothetical protein